MWDGDAGTERTNPRAADLHLDSEGSAFVPLELWWRGGSRRRPWRLGASTWAHFGRFEHYPTARMRRGLAAATLLVEQGLGRFAGSTLWAFSHASTTAPADRAVATSYADAGLVLGGGPWGRAADRAGIGATGTWFGRAYRAAAGAPLSAFEATVEATYRWSPLPWAHLQPTLQWVIQPHFSRNDAFVAGLRGTVQL